MGLAGLFHRGDVDAWPVNLLGHTSLLENLTLNRTRALQAEQVFSRLQESFSFRIFHMK